MDSLTIGFIGLGVMVLLLAMGMPVFLCMGLVGFGGLVFLRGLEGSFAVISSVPYEKTASFSLTVLPLFILMGNFAFHGGYTRELYVVANKFLGHLRGGLAIATIAGCTGFAAITGSSLAAAAAMGAVAVPEMRRFKYDDALATGTVAAGGTMGTMIPPSIAFVIYGMLTEQSIGKMLLAGILPGLLQAILYIGVIYVLVTMKPSMAPAAPRTPLKEAILSLRSRGVWAVLLIFVLVIGGIYSGICTPTEAGALGALTTLLISLLGGKLRMGGITDALSETTRSTGMVLAIIVGAMIFNVFLALSGLPRYLSGFVTSFGVSQLIVIAMMMAVYLVLGCFLDVLAMMILTIPILYPITVAAGINPILVGVLTVRMVEVAMITPPVGVNVFVIHGSFPEIPMATVFRGIMPFLVGDLVSVILLVSFPQISLFIPNMMR